MMGKWTEGLEESEREPMGMREWEWGNEDPWEWGNERP